MPTKPKSARLTVAQIEIVGQFNDYSFENKELGFEEVAKMVLGTNPFPDTPNGRKFRAECEAAFDLERAVQPADISS
jgi:hypothetical protein